MKKTICLTILLAVFATLLSNNVFSQQTNQTKIIGTWTFDKFDFLKPESDSLHLIKDAMGMTITFGKEGKYSTTQGIGDKVKDVETGTYSISSDGKTITQQGQNAEIIILTDQELAMKVDDEIVIHLKRVTK
jgi:hypothetical protein